MRVLLVYPRYKYGSPGGIEEPLGILYIASALRDAGHEVRFIDLTFENSLRILDDDVRWADVVGMSSTSAIFGIASAVLRYVKGIKPTIFSIIGGPHSTMDWEDSLKGGFDAAVLGEGEATIVELLRNFEGGDISKTRGIAYRDNGTVLRTETQPFIHDLDRIIFPARDLLDFSRYRYFGFMATRGCPNNCLYCKPMQDKLFGKKVRTRTVENVIDELQTMAPIHGKKPVSFRDDMLTLYSKEWFAGFGEELRKRKLKFQWYCNSTVAGVDFEKLKLMKESGCTQLYFGVESGSQKVLDFYRKTISPERVVQVFEWCHKLNLRPCAFLMIGAPNETREDLELTYRLVKRIKPFSWKLTATTAYPGNDLFNYAAEHNLLVDTHDYLRYDYSQNARDLSMTMKLQYLTQDDLREYARKINGYMRFHLLFSSLLSGEMWHELFVSRGLRGRMGAFLKNNFVPRKLLKHITSEEGSAVGCGSRETAAGSESKTSASCSDR